MRCKYRRFCVVSLIIVRAANSQRSHPVKSSNFLSSGTVLIIVFYMRVIIIIYAINVGWYTIRTIWYIIMYYIMMYNYLYIQNFPYTVFYDLVHYTLLTSEFIRLGAFACTSWFCETNSIRTVTIFNDCWDK